MSHIARTEAILRQQLQPLYCSQLDSLLCVGENTANVDFLQFEDNQDIKDEVVLRLGLLPRISAAQIWLASQSPYRRFRTITACCDR